MSDPDVTVEIKRLVENLFKLGVDITTEQVGPLIGQGFDTLIGTLQGIISEDNLKPLLDLQDTIMNVLTPIFTPIISQLVGVAKKPMGSTDESVMQEVGEVITTVVMTGIVISVVAVLPELAHPLKNMGLGRIAPIIVQMGGFDRISATIMNILVERTMGARLRYATNTLFTPYIPNQQDLVRFTVREVLTPSELEGNMKKLGFSEEWSDNYWKAHWELVGVRQLFQMFHRGIITKDDMRKMLIRHDFDSKDEISAGRLINWPENLIELSETPIPRVDLRYAWEAGLISDAEMARRMKMLGYSDQDATIEAVIQKRRTLTEEINAVRREVINDFKEGIITENAFLANLSGLGDTEQASNYRLEAAKYFQTRDHKKDMIREIEKALGRGNIEEGEAKDELIKLEVQEWRVLQIVELAALKLRLKPDEVTYLETT